MRKKVKQRARAVHVHSYPWRLFKRVLRCFISWDFSHLRLKETFWDKNDVKTWSNRWAWIRLFGGLIEFKFHLTNCTYNRPWYYGIVVRFRVSICGVFKPHLVLCIGPEANGH